jgi:hypothetical protein
LTRPRTEYPKETKRRSKTFPEFWEWAVTCAVTVLATRAEPVRHDLSGGAAGGSIVNRLSAPAAIRADA